jgi:hypothetical protein
MSHRHLAKLIFRVRINIHFSDSINCGLCDDVFKHFLTFDVYYTLLSSTSLAFSSPLYLEFL